ERFGLSFKHDEVIKRMISKWNWDGELDFTQTWLKEIYNGLQYEDNEHQCIWDSNDIIDSLRILDSIPFRNIDIIRTTKAFPLIIHRDNIAVYVAPRMLKILGNGEIRLSGQDYKAFDKERDSRIFTTEQSNLIGNWVLVERFLNGKPFDANVECGNCGAMLHPPDWHNRVYVENHPDCFCMCDCSNCQYANQVMQYMMEIKATSFRKKLTTKN